MITVDLGPNPGSLLLKFEYDADLVAKVKMITGRRFDKKLVGWIIPYTQESLSELPLIFGCPVTPTEGVVSKSASMAAVALKSREIKTSPAPELGADFRFPTTQPLAHQKRGLAIFASRNTYAFFWEMRSGKSFLALSGMQWLRDKGEKRPFLVVAPASVLHVWSDQAQLHQPGLKVRALEGSTVQRKVQLSQSGHDILVVNPESLWRLEDELLRINWGCLIVDESHKFKHRSAKQTKTLLKLSHAITRKYLLSGSPHDNSPLELWSQMAILDLAILGSSFYGFRDRYSVLGGYQGKQVVAYRNLEELNKKISRHSHRVATADCFDLPPRMDEVRKLDLEGDQLTAYKAMARDLVAEVAGTEITATVLAAKLIKLRQILAGFAFDSNHEPHYLKNNAKLKALEELLEEIPKDQKLVVWAVFHPEMSAIEELCKNLGIESVRLDGSVPIQTRKSIVDRFNNVPECRVFIGQAQAGGLGIDLSAASKCVFNSNEYDRSARLQAEARIVGPNQKSNSVSFYEFVCRGTWDVTALRKLKTKAEISEKISAEDVEAAVYGNES